MRQLGGSEEEATAVRVERPAEVHRLPEDLSAELRAHGHVLIGGSDMWGKVAVDIDFAGGMLGVRFVAVGLQQAGLASLGGEPGQFSEEPGVVDEQVIFQVAEQVILPQSGSQEILALKSKQERICLGRVVVKTVGRQGQIRKQVPVACRADDNLKAEGSGLVGEPRLALADMDQTLRRAKVLVKISQASGERRQARLSSTTLRGVGATRISVEIMGNGKQQAHGRLRAGGSAS